MPTLPESLAALFANFRADDDEGYDALAAHYAPDMVFIDPIQRVEGRDAFNAMNKRVFKRFRYVRFEDVSVIGAEPHFVITWTMVFRAKVGGEMRAPGVSEIKTRDGKVIFHRDHWDLMSTIASASPVAEAVYKRFTALLG